MVERAAGAGIPLVMSLSPFISRHVGAGREIGHVYQSLCVEAWRASGFRVISVNAASEAPRVAALYPGVEIAIARRDMTAVCGKPLVPLAEMVAALRRTGEPFGGIVNSDVFVPPCGLAAWLESCGNYECLLMNREEIDHPAARWGSPYHYGFDAFFVRLSALDGVNLDPFAIGLPWWDYLLPISLLLKGCGIGRIIGAPLRHLSHPHKWDENSWQLMFDAFRQRFDKGFARLADQRGDSLPTLVGLVHEGRMCRYFAEHPVRRSVDEPGFDALRRYRGAYSISVTDLILQMSEPVCFRPSKMDAAA